jgi:hypothetical protein
MGEVAAIIFIMLGIAAITFYVRGRKNTDKHIYQELDMLGIGKHLAKFEKKYVTPLGAQVRSTVDVPNEFLSLIDDGIQNQIVRHNRAFPNWNNFKMVSDYKVLLIEPMGTNKETEPGSPCIFVNGWQTAGTCLGTYERTKLDPYIVVPHQAQQNWQYKDYFMRSVWHESEHAREWKNLLNEPTGRFFYYANSGDVHPHVGDE